MPNIMDPYTKASKHRDSILIVGGGTWGTSVAYQLAKRGYQKITVLDVNPFPSSIAAGNDINKILEERMHTYHTFLISSRH
jgi:glycine/D-amino acid oxidase-like deaminating enzyme